MEVRFTEDPRNTKLQRSSSVAEGLDEAEAASLTMLTSGQWGSSQFLGFHEGRAVIEGEHNMGEGGSASHNFMVHAESSPGDQILKHKYTQTEANCTHLPATTDPVDTALRAQGPYWNPKYVIFKAQAPRVQGVEWFLHQRCKETLAFLNIIFIIDHIFEGFKVLQTPENLSRH